jgi:hypothetical protein
VDVYGCDPGAIRSREHIIRFMHKLCDLIGVKRFGETQVVRFGADSRACGHSMVQLIEASLVSAHFVEDSNTVYLDILQQFSVERVYFDREGRKGAQRSANSS